MVAIPTHSEPFFKDLQQRTAQLRGSSKGIFETGFEPGASHRPYFVTRPVARWLERQLDFPNWTKADINSMPETHISEWAKTENVELDPGYANEQREGGTPALGSGVPGLSRKDLSVFTPEEWEQNKSKLIYEQWVQEAKSRIGRTDIGYRLGQMDAKNRIADQVVRKTRSRYREKSDRISTRSNRTSSSSRPKLL